MSRAESSGKPWYGWPEDRFLESGGVDYFTFSSSSNVKGVCHSLEFVPAIAIFTRPSHADALVMACPPDVARVQGTAEAGAIAAARSAVSAAAASPVRLGARGAVVQSRPRGLG